MPPKLSIIIISYNEANYLQRAIDSCIAQSFTDIEIIIGDDGSDDGSLEIIKDNKQANRNVMDYFVMDRPLDAANIIPSFRVSDIIKKGLRLARGKYITILSGDDYYSDLTRFERAIDFLEKNSDYIAVADGFKRSDSESVCVLNRINCYTYWSGYYLHVSCFVFRRISPNLLLQRFCDDTGLVYSLTKLGKWETTDYVSFVYFQRADSIMKRADDTVLQLIEMLLYQDILNENDSNLVLKMASCRRFYQPFKSLYYKRHQLGDGNYTKYIEASKTQENDIIGMIINEPQKSKLLFLRMFISRVFFKLKIIVYGYIK